MLWTTDVIMLQDMNLHYLMSISQMKYSGTLVIEQIRMQLEVLMQVYTIYEIYCSCSIKMKFFLQQTNFTSPFKFL